MGDAILTRRFVKGEAQLNIVKNGLVFFLNAKTFSGGNTWQDSSGNGNNFTITNSLRDNWSNGLFNLDVGRYLFRNPNPATSSVSTVVFLMKTTDTQALFVNGEINHPTSGNFYLGAYSPSNTFYNSSTLTSTPTFHQDNVQRSNIYNFIRTNNWHMLEFKNAGLSNFPWFKVNDYNSFEFSGTQLAAILVYNRNLTLQESQQNYQAFKTILPLA
jgi:hypothetical protein